MKLGRKPTWDPKNETFPGDDEASKLPMPSKRTWLAAEDVAAFN